MFYICKMNFNGYLYSLLIRDLKKEFPHNHRNTRKYFIISGAITNIILLKENKFSVDVIFASEFEIVKRKSYRCKWYKKILNNIKEDFEIWNNI